MTKNLFKKLIALVVIVLINTPLFSQENFVAGYIINQNGDTIRGFVDYRNWGKNPNKVSFRNTINSEIKFYTPLEISAFSALDEIYKSAVVKVDNSNVKEISTSSAFNFRTDTIFLQTFFQGSKSLYYYKDNYDQDNFYLYNNSQFELLEFKKYIKADETGHQFLLTNKRFIGQLRFYLKDCPNIDMKLKDLAYNPQSLQKLFEYYYSQMKNEVVLVRTNEKLKAEFGIVLGLSIIDLKFVTTAAIFDPLPKAKFDNSINPTGGLFMNIVLPRNNGKWSIYNELMYSRYNTKAVYNDFSSEENYEIHHYKVDYSYAKLNNMLRFKYPIGKIHGFVNAGISNGFIVSEMNSDSINRRYNGTTTTFVQKIIADSPSDDSFESKKHELGYLIGLGVNYKNFFTEFRFEAGTGISQYIALKVNANRYNFLIGYRF